MPKSRYKRSVGFPYQLSGICRARINDKFRPRYSAGVHRTYSFVNTSVNLANFESIPNML